MSNSIFDIQEYHGVVSDEFCDEVISGFERETSPIPSHVYNKSDPAVRSGKVVFLKDIVSKHNLKGDFLAVCDKYLEAFRSSHMGLDSLCKEQISWTEPRVEKVDRGGGFVWHMDTRQVGYDTRFLTVILYLNDVQSGGELEFLFHRKIIPPKRGHLVMFPPYWTHAHRGNPPVSGAKYAVGAFCLVSSRHEGAFFSKAKNL